MRQADARGKATLAPDIRSSLSACPPHAPSVLAAHIAVSLSCLLGVQWSKGYVRQATALFYQKKYKGEQRTLAHFPNLLFRCDGTIIRASTGEHMNCLSL